MTEFWGVTNEPDDPLRSDLINMIRDRDNATPRARQRELGPSEVAHPCMKRMAYGMMEIPRCNPQFDPLPAIIGTATHKWLESAAMHANHVLGRQRWLTETRVNVTPGLSGSCDLYDHDTATVIDWKVIGNSRFDKYRKDPGPVFPTQVQLYGLGFENAGLPVKTVAVGFLPRGRTLHSFHLWKQDYDRSVAEAAVQRRYQVIGLLRDFDVDNHPESYAWFPKTPYDCVWCPWFKPDPTSTLQCQGDQ